MGRQYLFCVLLAAIFPTPSLLAQIHRFDQTRSTEQVEVSSPAVRRAEAPPSDAAPASLEERGDVLRSEKSYLDALDYYRAASELESRIADLERAVGASLTRDGHESNTTGPQASLPQITPEVR